MDEQPRSYWITVLLAGPVTGMVVGVLWSALMAAFLGQSVMQVFLPGGLLFGLTMGLTFTVLYAVAFWGVRREVPVTDVWTARQALLDAAAKVRYRLIDEVNDYMKFQPRMGLYKPACSYVQAWFAPGRLILVGPHGSVKRFLKRMDASSS